jgi:hypothetical protein
MKKTSKTETSALKSLKEFQKEKTTTYNKDYMTPTIDHKADDAAPLVMEYTRSLADSASIGDHAVAIAKPNPRLSQSLSNTRESYDRIR